MHPHLTDYDLATRQHAERVERAAHARLARSLRPSIKPVPNQTRHVDSVGRLMRRLAASFGLAGLRVRDTH